MFLLARTSVEDAAKRRKLTFAVAGIAALSITAAAVVYWSGDDRPSATVSPANAQRFASVSLNRLTTTGTASRAAIAGHYNSREPPGERITVVPLDGGAPRLFPNVTIPAEWSGDAKSLLFLVTRDGGTNIWRQPIAGGPSMPVTRFTDERIFRFTAS